MEDVAVHEAAAALAETSMSESDGYSDISDAEDPVEPVRLDVLPEGTNSGDDTAGTIGQLPSTTSVLGNLAQPMPLHMADLLAVIRMASSTEVSAAVPSSLRR